MKKAAALAALSAVLLAGCSSSNGSDSVSSVNNTFQSNQTQQAQDFSATSPEEMYLRDVRAANDPNLMDESDSSLLDVGHQTCSILDQGYTVAELVTYLLSDNPTQDQIQYESIIIGNAIEYFCPEYLNQLG